MFREDPLERHRLSRVFRGRLVELQFASWLESQRHTIIGLEAIRKGSDIETLAPDGTVNAFEVKFIGLEDTDFATILRSMGGAPAGGAISAYNPVNYLLFRVYEAARQLKSHSGRKTVVVIIEELAWYRFDPQVRKDWIDWNEPRFLFPDAEWQEFLSLQEVRYPDIKSDLRDTIHAIDSIKIFRQNHVFEFSIQKDIAVAAVGGRSDQTLPTI